MFALFRRFRRDERGQILPLALLLLLAMMVLTLPMITANQTYGSVALVQRAADAAAIAGAGQAILEKQTDARGQVYCETVAVNPSTAPTVAAQFWQNNLASMPSIQTVAFSAVPNGATLTVTATVSMPGGGFTLVGQNSLSWSLLAEAEVVQPSGVPAC